MLCYARDWKAHAPGEARQHKQQDGNDGSVRARGTVKWRVHEHAERHHHVDAIAAVLHRDHLQKHSEATRGKLSRSALAECKA